MKKIAFVSFIFALGIIGVYTATSHTPKTVFSEMALNNAEAVAGCETSSNPSNNTGYCLPLTGGSGGDACVDKGASDAVRCSGNN